MIPRQPKNITFTVAFNYGAYSLKNVKALLL